MTQRRWNSVQPGRPTHNEAGELLQHRTHVTRMNSTFPVFSVQNMEWQALLYWWARREYTSGIAIADLYSYLSYGRPHLAKRSMGAVVVQSTIYEPRLLKGVTKNNAVARVLYVWKDPLDLIYGLEWMLAMWVWRFEQTMTIEHCEKCFEDLAACERSALAGLWLDPCAEIDGLPNFTWANMWDKHGWELEEERRPKTPAPPPPKSRV